MMPAPPPPTISRSVVNASMRHSSLRRGLAPEPPQWGRQWAVVNAAGVEAQLADGLGGDEVAGTGVGTVEELVAAPDAVRTTHGGEPLVVGAVAHVVGQRVGAVERRRAGKLPVEANHGASRVANAAGDAPQRRVHP